MKEIYWKKLSLLEKIVFCFGWLAVGNGLFWIILLLKRFQFQGPAAKKELSSGHSSKSVYQKLFNPDTYKVVYVFGWINFIACLAFLLVMLVFFLYVLFNVNVYVQ